MTVSEQPNNDCRIVEHALGETCIPNVPKRVVALNPPIIFDPLLSLGIKPVGIACFGNSNDCFFPGLSPNELQDVEIVGTTTSPSLERIATLQPDLILTMDWNSAIYERLSDMAPTVVFDYDTVKLSFKDNLRHIAQLVNREEKVEELLDDYQSQVQAVREKLGNQLQGAEVSVISHHSGDFWTSPSYANYFQVLQDIGVTIKPIFFDPNEPKDSSTFSLEIIGKYDADILFIVDNDRKPSSYFFENELISALNAVKNERAYIVSRDIWDAYGPLGMSKLLDEMFTYLLEAAQTL